MPGWFARSAVGAIYPLGASLFPSEMNAEPEVTAERAANDPSSFFYGDGLEKPGFFELTGQWIADTDTELRLTMDTISQSLKNIVALVCEESTGATWEYAIDPMSPVRAWIMWKPDRSGLIASGTIKFAVASWKRAPVQPLPIRIAAGYTTGLINPNSTEVGRITMANGIRVYKISTSAPARVRLYSTMNQRDADLDRPVGTDPLPNAGVILDVLTTPNHLAFLLVPSADGQNGETVYDSKIAISVENRDTFAKNVSVGVEYVTTYSEVQVPDPVDVPPPDPVPNPPPPQTPDPVIVPPGSNNPNVLFRSRRRQDYNLPDNPITITEAALLSGSFGAKNAEGWYEIKDHLCHSLTPGVPCIRIKSMSQDLWVKIIRPVVDGLGVPGSNAGGTIVAEGNNTVWVDDGLGFSSPPPVGGNGKGCATARFFTANAPRWVEISRSEIYHTGGIYVDGIAQGGKFRGIRINRIGGYNIKGTGYNADGTIRFKANTRFDTSEYLGYLCQLFQINNCPEAAEDSIIVEDFVTDNDPMAMLGRYAGQREDIWNVHSASGVLVRRFLAERGLPWDPNFTGTQAVYGADPTSPSGRGYGYSGSDGLGDGYVKHGFSGTPTAEDIPHHVKAEDFTSLNNVNVGAGVTAGNRCKFKRGRVFMAGVMRSNAPSGYSKLAVKPAGDGTGESGNNAAQAYQFYMAQGDKALFFGHEIEDLTGSYNWIDKNGQWQQHILYISDPNSYVDGNGVKQYPSFVFKQNGVVKRPYDGGILPIPKPTSVASALATYDAERKFRIDSFIAAGTIIGMSDRTLGDVDNHWNRGASA